MTEPWFSPQTAPLFSFLSLLSLCSLFGVWAKRGVHQRLVMSVWNACLGLGVLLVALSAVAFIAQQPSHVSRTLALTGTVVGFTFVGTRHALRRHYRDAELRRTVANDL